MSADTLRRAAALMRERAEAARSFAGEDRWAFMNLGWNDVQGMTYTVSDTFANVRVAEVPAEEPAEHIASWHPAVAVAVADWLNLEANMPDGKRRSDAYIVARAYLGDES